MFLDKVISVLPKIGGIAGRLLTEICNDEEGYIQYDLPNPTQNGADGDTTPAIFTNENGKILLTNHALRKSRYVLMHFPASPLADLDDIAIPGSFQADVSRRFHEHAQYNDGQFELSTYDADAPKHTDGPNSRLNHVSKSGIPTDGTAVSFGAGFLISVNGDKLTIQSKYNDLTIYGLAFSQFPSSGSKYDSLAVIWPAVRGETVYFFSVRRTSRNSDIA